ncbi:MAG: efflux RND transporter periplasmic adaptor subunit [bacterium]
MAKKKRKKLFWILGSILLIIIVIVIISLNKGNGDDQFRTVTVKRQNIVDKALAVGTIEPVNEIAVKSKIPGVVGKIYVEVGDFIELGEPLLKVKPDPTPVELVQTKREVERQKIKLETLKHQIQRNKELKEKNLISDHEFELLKRDYKEVLLNYTEAQERLDLIEKGRVTIENKRIESVIKAPITGWVLEKLVDVGNPIVPLTSYQPGTELLTMADMKQLIFRGTVDEIDVGKIQEGMKADLEIGALPGKNVAGRVSMLSLKSRNEENRTVFPIEVIIEKTTDVQLRAGFSANAHIIIEKKDSVLSIPERVVTFRNDSTFVRLPAGEEKSEEVYIETGLSDAINIEVISGLNEGDTVLEKEIKEIE